MTNRPHFAHVHLAPFAVTKSPPKKISCGSFLALLRKKWGTCHVFFGGGATWSVYGGGHEFVEELDVLALSLTPPPLPQYIYIYIYIYTHIYGHNLNQWAKQRSKIQFSPDFIVENDPKNTHTLGVGVFRVSMFCLLSHLAFFCLSFFIFPSASWIFEA